MQIQQVNQHENQQVLAAVRKYFSKRSEAQNSTQTTNLMMSLLASINRTLEPGATVPLVELVNNGATYYDPSSNVIYLSNIDGSADVELLEEYAYGSLRMTSENANEWALKLINESGSVQ